jgi:WD40 repeat protein
LIAVTYSPDGKLLASVSGDGAVKVWDLSILKAKTTLQGIREVRALAFAPDGRTLAFCGFEMEKETILVKLFDPMAGKEKATIRPRMDCPKALAFSPDGKRLALAGELGGGKMVIGDQGLVILWKLEK